MDDLHQTQERISSNFSKTKTIFYCWADALRCFANMSGRMTRYEFWSVQSINILFFGTIVAVAHLFDCAGIVFEVCGAYMLMPFTSACVRRLHDIGYSGKYAIPLTLLSALVLVDIEYPLTNAFLTFFLWLVYFSYLFSLLAQSGERAANVYGQPVEEAQVYDQFSVYFIRFAGAVLACAWMVFFICL